MRAVRLSLFHISHIHGEAREKLTVRRERIQKRIQVQVFRRIHTHVEQMWDLRVWTTCTFRCLLYVGMDMDILAYVIECAWWNEHDSVFQCKRWGTLLFWKCSICFCLFYDFIFIGTPNKFQKKGQKCLTLEIYLSTKFNWLILILTWPMFQKSPI